MVEPFDLSAAKLACLYAYLPQDVDISSDFEILQTQLKDSKFNPHASSYVVVRSKAEGGVVFLAFRGTQDLSDMMADFNCQPREIDDAEPSFFVHGGIYETAKQSMKGIIPCLNAAHITDPITNLIFTGHSLGGACAMAARLFTLQLKQRGLSFAPNCRVVTFGAPLLFSFGGSIQKADDWDAHEAAIKALFTNPFLQTIHKETYCYVNDHDLVPRIFGKKKKQPGQENKSAWEDFLERNLIQGLSSASVEFIPGASAGAASVAGTGAIVLSPTIAVALLSTIFIPIVAIPGLLLSIPMMATTKALPPTTNTSNGEPRPRSDLEIKYEHFMFHAISWAVLTSKGHHILDSEQLTGYFPLGTFFFLRGWERAAPAPATELAAQEAGLDVPRGSAVQRCIADHGGILYLNKLELIASKPLSVCPPARAAVAAVAAAAAGAAAPSGAAGETVVTQVEDQLQV